MLRAKPSTKILQPTLNREEGRVEGEGDFIWLGRFLLSQDAAHTPWICFRKTRLSSVSCASAMQPIIINSKSAELLWTSRINQVLQLIGWITSQLGHLTLHSTKLITHTLTASEDSLELPQSLKQSICIRSNGTVTWNSMRKVSACVCVFPGIYWTMNLPKILHRGWHIMMTIRHSLIFYSFLQMWRFHHEWSGGFIKRCKFGTKGEEARYLLRLLPFVYRICKSPLELGFGIPDGLRSDALQAPCRIRTRSPSNSLEPRGVEGRFLPPC